MSPEVPAVTAEVRRIHSLRRRSERDRTGLFFVEGIRQVFRALNSDREIEQIVYSETLAPAIVQKRVRAERKRGHRVTRVSPETFRCVSTATHASGIGALVRQRWSLVEQVDLCAGLCWLAVGAIRSPGNLGSMIRTAEAVGAKGLIALDPNVDPFDPGCVRGSMGSIFGLELVRASPPELFLWAQAAGCRIAGTSPVGSTDLARADLRGPVIVLFGEERKGMTEDQHLVCSQTIALPMPGATDSINVSVAAGVLLYELLRRRHGEIAP